MKRLLALAAVCALALSFAVAWAGFAGPHAAYREPQGRTYSTSTSDPSFKISSGTAGFVDSTSFTPSLSLAIDTTETIWIKGAAQPQNGDSNAVLTVEAVLTAAAGATDSFTVAVDGSVDGTAWNALGSTIPWGQAAGFSSTTGAFVVFNGGPGGTTNVSGKSPVGALSAYATQWFRYQALRLRIKQRVTNTAGAITERVYLSFGSNNDSE